MMVESRSVSGVVSELSVYEENINDLDDAKLMVVLDKARYAFDI